MSKFAQLDDSVCDYIRRNPGRSPHNAKQLQDMAAGVLGLPHSVNEQSWRLIDRRLQAMRKAGRIKYARASLSGVGGWSVEG
jgi:chorismate mutase